MSRIRPDSPDARYCVSTSRYFPSRVEAEAEFERVKDAWPDITIEFWEKDSKGQWKDTDWFGFDEE